MRKMFWILSAGLSLFLGNDRGLTQGAGRVEVQVVKYDGLKEAVLKNRGKVLVLDFWSTTCISCIKNFPHMLEMQRKYARDGLVCISVNIDPIGEGQTPDQRKEKVLNRLRKLQSTITNLILDEKTELVQQKLRVDYIPSVYVFSRQGKWTQFTSTEEVNVNPADVEKLVVELLKSPLKTGGPE